MQGSRIDDIRARNRHTCYGMGLGIIILDDVYPGFPGDVRNASSWPYPVQYEVVENVNIYELVDPEVKTRDHNLEPILKAARKLERMGCRAIAAECGYFCYFQRHIADAVDIPVFMSSLLQIPLAQQIIKSDQTVGILTGFPESLTKAHLSAVGIEPGSRYRLFTTFDCGSDDPEFDKLWSTQGKRSDPPGANYVKAEREIITAARQAVESDSSIGAMVLECTGHPPFARAIQRELNLPVFSWATLLDYAYSIVVHRDFYGHV